MSHGVSARVAPRRRPRKRDAGKDARWAQSCAPRACGYGRTAARPRRRTRRRPRSAHGTLSGPRSGAAPWSRSGRAARAFVGWAFFTGLLAGLANLVLPEISRPLTPVVVGLAALTAVAVAALSLDYFRRAKRDDTVAALTLGLCLAAIGLTLDAALLLATDFRDPNVDAEKTGTLAVLLLLGYAVAAVAPVAVLSVPARSVRDFRRAPGRTRTGAVARAVPVERPE